MNTTLRCLTAAMFLVACSAEDENPPGSKSNEQSSTPGATTPGATGAVTNPGTAPGTTPGGNPPGTTPPGSNPPGTTPPGSVTAPTNTARMCNSSSSTTEQYDNPAPSTLPTGVSFLSDWPNRSVAGGFNGLQAMDDCRYKLDSDFQTWHGKFAVRVEVNPGDDPISSGAERTEVLVMRGASGDIEESKSSGTVFVATSYYFPTTWDGTFLHGNGESWSAIMQFHPSGDTGYFAGMQAGRRDVGEPQKFYWTSEATYELSDGGEIKLGEWVDFVVQFGFGDGAFKIYRRNQGAEKFTQVVSATDATLMSTDTTYFKQGLYRGPDVNGRTDVLWIGPTSRGATFAAVEQASFGTDSGF